MLEMLFPGRYIVRKVIDLTEIAIKVKKKKRVVLPSVVEFPSVINNRRCGPLNDKLFVIDYLNIVGLVEY